MKKKMSRWMAIVCAVPFMGFAQNKEGSEGTLDGLTGNDRVAFVASFNRSYAKSEEPLNGNRIKSLYRVNRDAVRGAEGADRKAVLAEVFATAPKASLPEIVDGFASELFSRKAGGFKDDEAFIEFASAALLRISGRLNFADDEPGVRSAFAVVMFLKASEGRPDDLREMFMPYVRSGSHVIAREEWFPAAMGDGGKTPTYEPMLTAGIRGEAPNHRISIPQGGPEELNRLAGSENQIHQAWDVSGPMARSNDGSVPDDGNALGTGILRVPRDGVQNRNSPWYRRTRRADEPSGYLGQSI